jgi:hypothetical protein
VLTDRLIRRGRSGAIVAAALVFFGALSTSGSTAGVRADPLQGTWETAAVSIRDIREVLVKSGSSDAQVTSFFTFFRMKRAWRNRLVFYREGTVRFLAMSGWDPTTRPGPAEPDHGPYVLLSGHRFVARGVDPPSDQARELFSYSVTPSRLTLRFISLKEPYPQFSRADLVRDTMLMRLVAAFPYRRVG